MRTYRRTFALKDTTVLVRDVHMSRDFEKVLNEEHAQLVINAGFFDTHEEPLGFAMSDGKMISKPRPQLSGGVVLIDNDRATLIASEDFTPPSIKSGFGVQCRPRLVVHSRVNIRTDDGQRAERTALCIHDKGQTLDAVIVRGERLGDGPSLLDLARYMQSTGCEDALSLDGGPSTGMAEAHGALVTSMAPRGAVRHVVVFRSKTP